jgi:hypothetical protein
MLRQWKLAGHVVLLLAALIVWSRTAEGSSALEWQSAPALIHEARLSCAVTLGGAIYTVGGEHYLPYSEHNVVQRFDLDTDAWSLVAPLQQVISRPEAVVYDGEIWRIGGSDPAGGGPTPFEPAWQATVEIYDPVTDTWRWGPSTNAGHAMHDAVVVGDKIYLMDPWAPGKSVTSEVYDPVAGTWSLLPGTTLLQNTVQAASAGDGKILVVDCNGSSAIFNTLTNVWSAGPAVPMDLNGAGEDFWDRFTMVDDGEHAYVFTCPPTSDESVRAFAMNLGTLGGWIELANFPAVPYPHADFCLAVENDTMHMLARSYDWYDDYSAVATFTHETASLGDISVPEPVSLVFFGTGVVGVVGFVLRKRAARS